MQPVHLIEGDTPNPHSTNHTGQIKIKKQKLKLKLKLKQKQKKKQIQIKRAVCHTFRPKIEEKHAKKSAPKKHFSVYFQIQFQ